MSDNTAHGPFMSLSLIYLVIVLSTHYNFDSSLISYLAV